MGPPVPRRLVSQSQIPPNLSPAYTDTGSSLSGPRLASQHREIRAGPKQVFDFVGYKFDLKKGRPTPEHWQTLNTKIKKLLTHLSCQVHLG